jgi:hypothetical protein
MNCNLNRIARDDSSIARKWKGRSNHHPKFETQARQFAHIKYPKCGGVFDKMDGRKPISAS